MLDEVMLDPRLPLELRGLYALLTVLAKTGEPPNISQVAERSGLSRTTLRSYMARLADQGLLSLVKSEKDRRSQLVLLTGSAEERNRAMIQSINNRLNRARRRIREEGSRESIGEALMKEWLTLLIAVDLFTDNARPGFLVSPVTGERLEYDRWYPSLKQGWEFHGPQHFRLSKQQDDPAELARQQQNDLMKIGLSQRAGVTLIEVQATDLRLDRLAALIPPGTPLRSLAGLSQVVSFLEQECARYRHSLGIREA